MSEKYEYGKDGLMKYDPSFHDKQGKPFTREELVYLCKFHGVDTIQSLAFSLGRTEATIKEKVKRLKKEGLYEHYERQWKW